MDYEGFTAFLLRNNRRSTTIRKHINCLGYLVKNNIHLEKIAIEKFLVKLKEEGKSGAYLNSFVNCLNLYGNFSNQDLHIKRFKVMAGLKQTMSDAEIEAFLALSCPPHSEKKHWSIMTVFWSIAAFTGMRPGEIAHLKIDDVDFGRGVFYIRQSKTNQPGISPIPNNITSLIREHTKMVTDYLFPSKLGGTHYSAGGEAVIDNVDWHYDWKKRLKILGIKRTGLTPYSFRHSFATRLLEENVSLFHVKKLMHHSDLKSTLVYEHLTTKDLIQAIEKLPLIRKGTDPKIILQSLMELIKSFHIELDQRFVYKLEESDNCLKFKVCIKGR